MRCDKICFKIGADCCISIHAPRVRCDYHIFNFGQVGGISIHAPRVRCDAVMSSHTGLVSNFNPRTSCEVRRTSMQIPFDHINFNPRTSCEVRPSCRHTFLPCYYFNPRTSCEVRPTVPAIIVLQFVISIHAPRVRCDVPAHFVFQHFLHFNPRTSCEVRRFLLVNTGVIDVFQSTHLV